MAIFSMNGGMGVEAEHFFRALANLIQHPIYIIPHQINITDVTQLVLSVMCCVYLGFPFLLGHDT